VTSDFQPEYAGFRRRSFGLLRWSAVAALVFVALSLLAMRDFDWLLVKRTLRSRFTDVEWITTAELADWLGDKRRSPPLLLDVRTIEEWNVSHLPGARRIDPSADVQTVIARRPKTTAIVTYCAIGYRSADVATRLKRAGFSNVRNLEGSIFQWANEHRPLVRGEQAVNQVHPYDRFWGRLLVDDVRAPVTH
jgi:rhodanese-related sulfurtransferase